MAASSSSSGKSPSFSATPKSAEDATARGWEASLTLGFARAGAGTILARRAHHGPLAVQRPFFPEGPEVCHVYLLHPPGGLVGGDRLRVDVTVERDARALLTTPAATKAYRTSGPGASLQNRLVVARGGVLEWLPQETILYDGADLAMSTRVELAPGAAFLGLELLCFGLPARGEGFGRGRCHLGLELWRDGAPLVVERGRYDGADAVHAAAWGLGAAPVMGTFLAAAGTDVALAPVVEELAALGAALPAGGLGAATVLAEGGALACRYVGDSVERGGQFLRAAWRLTRRALHGLDASPPRIWST